MLSTLRRIATVKVHRSAHPEGRQFNISAGVFGSSTAISSREIRPPQESHRLLSFSRGNYRGAGHASIMVTSSSRDMPRSEPARSTVGGICSGCLMRAPCRSIRVPHRIRHICFPLPGTLITALHHPRRRSRPASDLFIADLDSAALCPIDSGCLQFINSSNEQAPGCFHLRASQCRVLSLTRCRLRNKRCGWSQPSILRICTVATEHRAMNIRG